MFARAYPPAIPKLQLRRPFHLALLSRITSLEISLWSEDIDILPENPFAPQNRPQILRNLCLARNKLAIDRIALGRHALVEQRKVRRVDADALVNDGH